VPVASFTKEQISPTRDTRLRWMQSVIHCTHYVSGAGEQAYLNLADAPEIKFIKRDEIDRSDEAWTEIGFETEDPAAERARHLPDRSPSGARGGGSAEAPQGGMVLQRIDPPIRASRAGDADRGRGAGVVNGQLVLSLFPGIGLLDMAFEETGFCVVRGPDLLWGGDVHKFHAPAGRFDGIIGGPPCQAFSRLRHIVEANGYQTAPNLIPEFERIIGEARPRWFLMENVEDAPVPDVADYGVTPVMLRDVWVGGETNRLRRFSFGFRGVGAPRFEIETLALHRPDPEPAVLACAGVRQQPVALGGSGKRKRVPRSGHREKDATGVRLAIRDQGLPDDFLARSPFTVSGKLKAVGNGVPLPMGRAVAKAVCKALGLDPSKDIAA
jgi:DNA (cytosine-5)-methyltransferase 1